MNVYVVSCSPAYETSDVLGVYASEDDAWKAALMFMKERLRDWPGDIEFVNQVADDYIVESFEVGAIFHVDHSEYVPRAKSLRDRLDMAAPEHFA